MKSLTALTFAFLLVASIAYSNSPIPTKLQDVKVYLAGAELTHTATVELAKGSNEYVFENFANYIDQNSIRVSTNGNASIQSVVQGFNYLGEIPVSDKEKKLRDSVETLELEITTINNELNTLGEEHAMILANQKIGSDKAGATVEEIQKLAAFFRKRISENKKEYTDYQIKLKKQNGILARLKSQLGEYESNRNKVVAQIIITISSEKAQKEKITIQYYTPQANWFAMYDIRVNDLSKPAQLVYKASVQQNTGIDWKDINISLSTRDPMISGNIPELKTVHINFKETYVARQSYVGKQNLSTEDYADSPLNPGYSTGSRTDDELTIDINYKTEQKQLSVDFYPKLSYSIPSDGKSYKIDVTTAEMPAVYEYFSAPKIRTEAYLVARIINWQDYSLLPGEANIFYENTFVGRSSIDPQTTTDTLTLSLGMDKNVVIQREVIKDFTENKFLSSDIERFFAYRDIIKNFKSSPIELTIEEQIPVSMNEDIKVKLMEYQDAQFNEETGKLIWKIKLEPAKTKELGFKFSVRHPKNKAVSNF